MVKKAFTLIELIFVIILTALLASFGTDILFNAYKHYLISKTESEIQYKLELTLDILAKRLSHSIPFTCIARKDSSGSDFNKIKTLKSLLPSDNYKIIECYLQAIDAQKGKYDTHTKYYLPGWSGFLDLYSSNTSNTSKTLHTLGSNLSSARDIIYTLSHGKCDLNKNNSNIGLLFPVLPNNSVLEAYGWKYDPSKLKIYEIYKKSEDIFGVTGNFPKKIYERYYLTWTAVAFVPEYNATTKLYNLYLYSNYRPWKNETFKNGSKYLITNYLQTFKFRQPGNQINLKLCITQPLLDSNVTLCSERIVF